MSDRLPIVDRVEWWPRGNVRPNPNNVREHSEHQLADLANMMRKVWTIPLLVLEDEGEKQHGMILAGHARYEAAYLAGYYEEVKVLVAENWPQELIDQYVLFDNQIALTSSWNEERLVAELNRIADAHGHAALGGMGFSQSQLDDMLNPKPQRDGVKGSLADAFGVPPFSVLIAREGWWQNRKRLWLALGIKSELGRADHVEGGASHPGNPGGGGRLYGGRAAGGGFSQQVSYGRPKGRKK